MEILSGRSAVEPQKMAENHRDQADNVYFFTTNKISISRPAAEISWSGCRRLDKLFAEQI